MLNIANLKSHMRCDENTGDLYWKRSGSGRRLYAPVGNTRIKDGKLSRTVNFEGVSYSARVLIWVLCTGKYPKGKIGVLDNNCHNLAFKNLYDEGILGELTALLEPAA